MPLLSFPELTQGYARFVLIDLYIHHSPFAKELNEIKKPYIGAIIKFAKDTAISFQEKPQSNMEYYETMVKYLSKESRVNPFSTEQEKDINELKPYFDALTRLVEKWIFKTPWAVGALFAMDLIQSVVVVPSRRQSIPLEKFELMVPWPPPITPLKIEVSAWTFFEYSRDEIICEIADRLFEYEEKLKETGIKEFPSSLLRHARWWFEHYVNGKSLVQISAQGINTGKGSANPYPKNIRKAIDKFSKLVEIDTKNNSRIILLDL
jgi:hypothetical protein